MVRRSSQRRSPYLRNTAGDRVEGAFQNVFPNEVSFMTEMQELQSQLAEALERIQHLEEEMSNGKELPRWQYLIARPHRWRGQMSITGRNMTVGQFVSTVRANRYTPERA